MDNLLSQIRLANSISDNGNILDQNTDSGNDTDSTNMTNENTLDPVQELAMF